jgi:hypothetical protein
MRISRTVLLAGTAGAAILLVAPLTAAAAAASLTAVFAQTSVWSTGYGAEFTVTNRGDAAATGWVVDGLYVHHIGDEGVHFRRSSSDGVIRNSTIEYTGTVQPAYGEGVYLGSANSNWACHGNSGNLNVVHISNSVSNATGGLTNITPTTG